MARRLSEIVAPRKGVLSARFCLAPIRQPDASSLGDAEVQALSGGFLESLAREQADLFVHWRLGMIGTFA
jgi:hypothetical protein